MNTGIQLQLRSLTPVQAEVIGTGILTTLYPETIPLDVTTKGQFLDTQSVEAKKLVFGFLVQAQIPIVTEVLATPELTTCLSLDSYQLLPQFVKVTTGTYSPKTVSYAICSTLTSVVDMQHLLRQLPSYDEYLSFTYDHIYTGTLRSIVDTFYRNAQKKHVSLTSTSTNDDLLAHIRKINENKALSI